MYTGLVFERRDRWLGQQIYEIQDNFRGILPRPTMEIGRGL